MSDLNTMNLMKLPSYNGQSFTPNKYQKSQTLCDQASMNTWTDHHQNSMSKKNSFRGRRASDEVHPTKDVLSQDTCCSHNHKHEMKMNCKAFVPKMQSNFMISEIDQKSNASETTKANSDQESNEQFEEGAFDESSAALGEWNAYCEATRKKTKRNFANAEERQEFNQKVEIKRKTEMCKNIIHFGECKFGSNCSYAHTKDELLKKKHVQSNYMTKLCTQFHDPECGVCNYGERCQFLHSIYDRRKPIGFLQGLYEGARLTMSRAEQIGDSQGADFVWVNLVKGDGCGAPKSRLPVFEGIYNKEQWQQEQQVEQQARIHSKKVTNFSKNVNFQKKFQSYNTNESQVQYPSRNNQYNRYYEQPQNTFYQNQNQIQVC